MSRIFLAVARRLVAIACWALPNDRAEWGAAMAAEFAQIDRPGEAFAWAIGCLRSMVMINLDAAPARYCAALVAATAVLLFCEWHTDETGFMFGLLLVIAGASGFLAPRHAILSALIIGSAILLAHFLSESTGYLVPRYQHQSPTVGDWLVMVALVLVAGFAAQVGALMRRHLV